MSHDATKVQLGATKSSYKEVDNRAGSIAAGLCTHLKSDGGLSIASADGSKYGISLGESQSGIARTAVVRKGTLVPIILTASFTPTIGAQVNISDTTGKAIAAGAGATAVNAIYSSGALKSVSEAGVTSETTDCALIDFPGGL